MMFGGTFEQATILRTGPDGLTRVIVRSSWAERESICVESYEAELLVFGGGSSSTARRWGSRGRGSPARADYGRRSGRGKCAWKTQKFEIAPYVGKLYFSFLAATIRRGLARESDLVH